MPKSSGTVQAVHLGPPLVLDLGTTRLEIPHRAAPESLAYLEQELLRQTIEFDVVDGQATVWYFRPVTEDDEVEYVYRVCLNAELARKNL